MSVLICTYMLQYDAYLEGVPIGKIGVFTDFAAHLNSRQPFNIKNSTLSSTIGLSLRAQGLRVDVGWPTYPFKGPRAYFGFDIED